MSFSSPERKREYMRNYYQLNHDKLRENEKLYLREYRRKLRSQIEIALGSKCKSCGFSDPRALQIDHINGGGHKERLTLGSTSLLRKCIRLMQNSPDIFFSNYQLLCANCNWIKRYTHDLPEGKSGKNR